MIVSVNIDLREQSANKLLGIIATNTSVLCTFNCLCVTKFGAQINYHCDIHEHATSCFCHRGFISDHIWNLLPDNMT